MTSPSEFFDYAIKKKKSPESKGACHLPGQECGPGTPKQSLALLYTRLRLFLPDPPPLLSALASSPFQPGWITWAIKPEGEA